PPCRRPSRSCPSAAAAAPQPEPRRQDSAQPKAEGAKSLPRFWAKETPDPTRHRPQGRKQCRETDFVPNAYAYLHPALIADQQGSFMNTTIATRAGAPALQVLKRAGAVCFFCGGFRPRRAPFSSRAVFSRAQAGKKERSPVSSGSYRGRTAL